MKSQFTHYEGLVKKDGKWIVVGKFETIEAAKEAGATKYRPRFNRV